MRHSPSPGTRPTQPRLDVDGGLVDIDGENYFRVSHYDAMPPFFMTVVSNSDHWLFLSTTGGLTAGRGNPDRALFPYTTDDRIHDAGETTGSKTLLRVRRGSDTHLWEPFSSRGRDAYRVAAALDKSVYGTTVRFEEVNEDLGVAFRYTWATSDRYGFVRSAEIENTGAEPVEIELLDGIHNVLPSGVGQRFQMEFSTLVDGYKRTERVAGLPLALFRLSSIPSDRAEPSEALRVNVAWSVGLDGAEILLSDAQLDRFRAGAVVEPEHDVRGQRGAFFLHSALSLEAGATRSWLVVADVDRDAVDVRALMRDLSSPGLADAVRADVEDGTRSLVRVVGSVDGLQTTGDERATWRHFSNALFNAMRGGLPDDGYRVSRDDLRSFLVASNVSVAERHAPFIDGLPETLPRRDLLERAARTDDLDLERLCVAYLPFTFSRRHGDPSRPWNRFSIEIRDERGDKRLHYEGNWRDIFQNWEALSLSYPDFTEGMIAKFLGSSTADGHNPYRVLREGFEWEVVDPDEPWSNIGYWGDHQVIYLLRLLEVAERHRPGCLTRLLSRPLFAYADVPYRIRPYADLLADPRNSIVFDHDAHTAALARAEERGADGLALLGRDGAIVRANGAEKILLVALAKLANFIPEAGIWMNTQRPEWNDGNNALVGNGVSVVTLCHLRRYLAFAKGLFSTIDGGEVELASEVADFLEGVGAALDQHEGTLGAPISDSDRRALLDALGEAGSRYRARVYAASFSGERATVTADALASFCDVALRHVDHSIRANRRDDGLFHAYNVMRVMDSGIEIERLPVMLEGQVAALSAGVLTAEEAVSLLDALRASDLYREDQASYLLYPDRDLPAFLDQNVVPADAVAGSALLTAMLDAGDTSLVARDVDGGIHFHHSFRNAGILERALDGLDGGPFGDAARAERQAVLDLYEEVFHHRAFTGRSGTFYKYEGLGSIYWHMVSKLALAVGEEWIGAIEEGADAAEVSRIAAHYHEIREGIGAHKSPREYGAIPTDPYSHTPSFAGAQQPGMTGQVKEDVISRFHDMGVLVENGRLRIIPACVDRSEFLAASRPFRYVSVDGRDATFDLEADSLGFTVCQVPIVLHRAGPARCVLHRADGTRREVDGLSLDDSASAAIFDRTGEFVRIDAYLGSTT